PVSLSPGVAVSVAGPAKRAAEQSSNPKITYSKETVAEEGDEVKIDCAVEGVDLTGVEDFSVSWSKINEEKPANSYPISTNERVLLFSSKYEVLHPDNTHQFSLIIKKINEEDIGLYRCTVYFGEDQRINADVPVKEGDAISIDCQPGGAPKPDVYWERVNQELPYYGGKFFKSNLLDLPLIERGHKGHYVCYADNGIGNPATSNVVLEVQYAPDVTVTKDRVFTSMNTEAILECTVFSHPPADIAWFKDDMPILGSSNLKIMKKQLEESEGVVITLTLLDTAPEDIGTYTCKAVNVIGSTNRDVELLTKSPPLIIKQSRKEVLYDQEKARLRDALPSVIECLAEGSPSPNYRWTKNGQPLIWQADSRLSIEEETGNLLIVDPVMEDNGLYQCFAYNELGTAVGDPVYFLNTTNIHFSNDGDRSDTYNVEAELGRPYKLSCPKAFGYPKPTMSWVKAKPHEEQIELEFVSDERIVADPEGNLWFTHITEDDDTGKNGFQYICLASTSFEPYDYSMASVIEMTVNAPADGAHNLEEEALNVESFSMYTSGDVVQFKAGEENSLWCIYGGEPVPSVGWRRKDGEELDPSRIITKNTGSTLVFNDTQVSDAGEYECSASNEVGTIKTQTLTVEVIQAPTFINELGSKVVKEGSIVTFTCDAEATDNVSYIWMFNGRILSSEGKHPRRNIKGNKLKIKGVTLTDVGNYACNATNENGYAYGQATLNVLPSSSSTGQSAASCQNVEDLRTEVAALRKTIELLQSLVTEQHGFAQQTHEQLRNISDKLQVPNLQDNTSATKLEEEKTMEEEEKEDLPL
ncbi:Neuroglian-like 3, partial [Homarus americanus]